MQMYYVPEHIHHSSRTQGRVIKLLKFWVETCPWDYNEKQISSLNTYLEGILAKEKKERKAANKTVNSLLQTIANHYIKAQKKTSDFDTRFFKYNQKDPPPQPVVPKNIFAQALTLADVDELEIARQLTIIEYSKFFVVTPAEVLQAINTADTGTKATSIMEIQNRFEIISILVQYSVLSPQEQKAKIKAFERFVKLAKHLLNLKKLSNFICNRPWT